MKAEVACTPVVLLWLALGAVVYDLLADRGPLLEQAKLVACAAVWRCDGQALFVAEVSTCSPTAGR